MKILIPAVAIAALVPLLSCTKVVDINLNKSNPKYVIEGNVTDQRGPYQVAITRTVNFDESNSYPPVSGALVIIADATMGITDTLSEQRPGRYLTGRIAGASGHSYRLAVTISGATFAAVSTMPLLVRLDTIVQGTGGFSREAQVIPVYADPAGTANYYLFLVTKKDTAQRELSVRNDVGTDGAVASRPLRTDAEIGDPITVEMQCIDLPNYDYFFGLVQDLRQTTATPSNPTSNISGGALGYFSAHTTQRRTIVLR